MLWGKCAAQVALNTRQSHTSMCYNNSCMADSPSYSKVNHKREAVSKKCQGIYKPGQTPNISSLFPNTHTQTQLGRRLPQWLILCVHAQLVFSTNRRVWKIPILLFASYLLRRFHYQWLPGKLESSPLLDIHSKSSTPICWRGNYVPGNSPLQVREGGGVGILAWGRCIG